MASYSSFSLAKVLEDLQITSFIAAYELKGT